VLASEPAGAHDARMATSFAGYDLPAVTRLLSRIVAFELAGVVRFTHYSLMINGPSRIPIVTFLKQQASESLLHAQQAGEILTGLGGHPEMGIAALEETGRHRLADVLAEGLEHERRAVTLYRELLSVVEGRSVYLEEFARGQVAAEELGAMEFHKMLRDHGDVAERRTAPRATATPRSARRGGRPRR
jgi:bacterioferritin